MQAVLFVIGAILTILGSSLVLYTEQFRRSLTNLTGAISLKILAILPILVGVLLVLSGPWSHSTWVVVILGVLALVKGVLLLVLPEDKIRPHLAWWQEKASDVTWRLFGLIWVILGVFLILQA